MVNAENKYTKMQVSQYNNWASNWSEENKDHVVGSFEAHNNWKDYENLFTRIDNQQDKIGLDFACGPGRNLVKYGNRFKRLDGVDISEVNIKNASIYTGNNKLYPELFVCNGVNLDIINSNEYDFVMSTIALQHICVHDIRFSIMIEIFRVLKDGGIFTAQMGFGIPSPHSVGYYDNNYDAESTNRACDTSIESEKQLEGDLLKIGFKDFEFKITQTGPGDCHPNWIFFSAKK